MGMMKIQKWGNSQGIRISKSLLKTVRWKVNENVEITTEDNSIVIKKAMSDIKGIDKRFADYKGEYKPVEIDWGQPQGREIW